jgi:hypothetical protein
MISTESLKRFLTVLTGKLYPSCLHRHVFKGKEIYFYFMINTKYILRIHIKILSILQNNDLSLVRGLLHKLRSCSMLTFDKLLLSSRRYNLIYIKGYSVPLRFSSYLQALEARRSSELYSKINFLLHRKPHASRWILLGEIISVCENLTKYLNSLCAKGRGCLTLN